MHGLLLFYFAFVEICSDGDVRLAGGQTPLVGRVEVCINEQYGTVCDVGFNRASAGVVCGQLGYSRISKSGIANGSLKPDYASNALNPQPLSPILRQVHTLWLVNPKLWR